MKDSGPLRPGKGSPTSGALPSRKVPAAPAYDSMPLPAGDAMVIAAPAESAFVQKLAGLRFWTFSALFHVVLLILVGGTIVYEKLNELPDFAPEGALVSTDSAVLEPPKEPITMQTSEMTPAVSPSTSASAPPIDMSAITTSASTTTFALNAAPIPVVKTDAAMKPTSLQVASVSGSLTKGMKENIGNFTRGWSKATGGKGGPLKNREFEFTAYLAKYAGGDWASTVRLEKDEIDGGSLPNLLFVMARLSKDKVSGHPQAKPLDLASEEIFVKKPPFIFFTGHRDFVLTDQEITNLRSYIMVGGCLWGDSSLAGRRSRFDIAFRREMRRVIPDLNKDWKELSANHPIFTKNYFPDIKEVPPGINFYHEPVYAIQGLGGEIGVLYTANDYGDMWQFGIDEHGEIDTSRDEKLQMVACNEQMWWRRNLYFRNIEGKALLRTYKFGMNVIIHLMTRWEDKIGMAGMNATM